MSVGSRIIMEDLETMSKEEYNQEPVFYCTKCLSLNILTNEDHTDLYCADCGRKHSHPKYIDITNIHKWTKLYIERKGHHPLADDPNPYEDWKTVYDDETAYEMPTKEEVIAAGLNYSEKMNRKIKD